MTQTIIHIGYHKTATNYFQKYYYPHVSNFTYIDRMLVQQLFFSRAFDFDPIKVKDYFEKSFQNNIIICEEELSGNIHTGGLHGFATKEIGNRLKRVFPNGIIVLFIRNQISMIDSVYKQYVKIGGNYSIKKYLRNDHFLVSKYPMFSYEHFNYYKLINYYVDLFGKENIKVFMYEELLLKRYDFLKRYSKCLGLQFDDVEPALRYPNISYTKSGIMLAKVINSFTNQGISNKYYLFHSPFLFNTTRKYLNKLTKVQVKINKSRFKKNKLINTEIIDVITNYYKESYTLLSDNFNLNLGKYNYPIMK